MSREEKVKAAVSGGYHPGGMTLVAVELAALNDLLAPVLAERFLAAVNATLTGERLLKRLDQCNAGSEVWVRGYVCNGLSFGGKLDVGIVSADSGRVFVTREFPACAEVRQ